MSDFIIGQIRTYVPILVGLVLTWIAGALEIGITEETSKEVISTVTAAAAVIYYFIVRVLAEKWGWVGTLLGYNKAPTYNEETPAA